MEQINDDDDDELFVLSILSAWRDGLRAVYIGLLIGSSETNRTAEKLHVTVQSHN